MVKDVTTEVQWTAKSPINIDEQFHPTNGASKGSLSPKARGKLEITLGT